MNHLLLLALALTLSAQVPATVRGSDGQNYRVIVVPDTPGVDNPTLYQLVCAIPQFTAMPQCPAAPVVRPPATLRYYANDPRAASWSDGAPTAISAGNRNGVYVAGVGSGFSLVVPKVAEPSVLRVHVGGYFSAAQLVAGTVTQDVPLTSGQYIRDYDVPVQAGVPVTWTMTGGSGNVTITGASLRRASDPTPVLNTPSAALTTEGTLDWVHWGETPVNRKAGAGTISDLSAFQAK